MYRVDIENKKLIKLSSTKFSTLQLKERYDVEEWIEKTPEILGEKLLIIYKELLLPIHKEITQQIGGPLILHVCGNCNDRLELFAEAGFEAYHFEWQMDAKAVVKKVGHRMSLVGCINNAQVLYQGTPDDAYKQARYAIEAGVNIIGPECAIPLATPLDNLKAIVSAVHEGY